MRDCMEPIDEAEQFLTDAKDSLVEGNLDLFLATLQDAINILSDLTVEVHHEIERRDEHLPQPTTNHEP